MKESVANFRQVWTRPWISTHPVRSLGIVRLPAGMDPDDLRLVTARKAYGVSFDSKSQPPAA